MNAETVSNEKTLTGQQIKLYLVEHNMTAKDLAEMIGASPKYLSKIITGNRSGSKKYMDKLVEIIGKEQ